MCKGFVKMKKALTPYKLLRAKASVFRAQDLEAKGVSRPTLKKLTSKGLLHRVGRGLYVKAGANIGENHTLAEIGRRVPNGVVCLLSALRFHNLTTQSPHEIWIAINRRAWNPKIDYLHLRVARFSGAAFDEGQEQPIIEGVPVRIYNPAKTIADCFKYRNKIGLDVAIEALREAWRSRTCTMSELTRYARICRVSNVMRPYLESLT
jgi:predicted transcriptional regulator of viral defense system